jgi:hypothetical protein
MARQNISVGNAPNDGTGDPLRVAFEKINNNFTDLYNNFGSSGLNFVANVISTSNSNDDINLVPSGSGQVKVGGNNPVRIYNNNPSISTSTGALTVVGGVGVGGNVEVGGSVYAPAAAFNNLEGTIIGAALPESAHFTTVSVTGDIVPSAANVYNIGSALHPFGNLFVETIISASTGFLSIDNTPIGNITPSTGQFTTLVANSALIQNLTVVNPFDEIIGNLIVEHTSVLNDDVSVGGQLYINWQDQSSNPIPGPGILPATTATYDIGSTGARFRDAYLSGNATVAGNITVAGKFIGDLIGGATSAITAGSTTYATTAGSATTAVTVTQASQPAIHSLGSLTGLTVNGITTLQRDVFFGNNAVIYGNSYTTGGALFNGGIMTDSTMMGLIPSPYTLSLSYSRTSTISMAINSDMTINYDTANVAEGAQATLIINNSDSVQHNVALPNSNNNKANTSFAVLPGVYAFCTFHAVHNPAGAPVVYCQIVNS